MAECIPHLTCIRTLLPLQKLCQSLQVFVLEGQTVLLCRKPAVLKACASAVLSRCSVRKVWKLTLDSRQHTRLSSKSMVWIYAGVSQRVLAKGTQHSTSALSAPLVHRPSCQPVHYKLEHRLPAEAAAAAAEDCCQLLPQQCAWQPPGILGATASLEEQKS